MEAHYLGLKWIMEHDKSNDFNLGSNQGFTVLEMIDALKKVSGREVPYIIDGRREGDPAVLVASNEKATTVLGWNPTHSGIEQILSDAWNWENNRKY
jgi:UDP-glucose 4-epimerase